MRWLWVGKYHWNNIEDCQPVSPSVPLLMLNKVQMISVHLGNPQSKYKISNSIFPWWCHQMETFSMLLSLCWGNPPVTSGFPLQRPVTWSFDVFWFAPEQTVQQTIVTLVIWDAIALIMMLQHHIHDMHKTWFFKQDETTCQSSFHVKLVIVISNFLVLLHY